jgi:hypothetical protein
MRSADVSQSEMLSSRTLDQRITKDNVPVKVTVVIWYAVKSMPQHFISTSRRLKKFANLI